MDTQVIQEVVHQVIQVIQEHLLLDIQALVACQVIQDSKVFKVTLVKVAIVVSQEV